MMDGTRQPADGGETVPLTAEVEELRAHVAELEGTLGRVWAADQRAIAAWRATHPGNDLVWPDRAALVEWLLARISGWELAAAQYAADHGIDLSEAISRFHASLSDAKAEGAREAEARIAELTDLLRGMSERRDIVHVELDDARKRISELNRLCDISEESRRDAWSQHDKQAQRIAELEQSLRKYGAHQRSCPSFSASLFQFASGTVPCTCGLEATLNALRARGAASSAGGACGKRCDHQSPCRLLAGHSPADRHETEHGCVFYDPREED